MRLPTLSDLEAAAGRLNGHAVLTPLLESPLANAALGGRLLVKAECLQRTGSFKFRGAFNRVSLMSPDERQAGVVAFSSGNHAQGVAHAAQLAGAPAVIVMPADAPTAKIAATRAYGAEVILYDRRTESREAIGAAIAKERGASLIPPYDDPDVIAGQGTTGLEIARQAQALQARIDAVIVCCSGGGLAAGIALALGAHAPEAELWAAEPEGFDDTARSLQAGERVSNESLGGSILDALLTPIPGELTFAINHQRLSGGVAVSEHDALQAMAFAFRHFKLVLEPGGAAALAAVTSAKFPLRGRTVVVTASGGNVDASIFTQALATGADATV